MTPMSHEYARNPNIIIDLYRDEQVTDRVYSTSGAIRNVSRVFDRMLDPENGFHPLTTETAFGRQLRVLSLPDVEDDADSLLIILKAVHYQYNTMPTRVTYKQLVNLAVVCEKYDCGSLLRPWTDVWVPALLNDVNHIETALGHEDWLLIGHIFPNAEGSPRVVERLSLLLAQECCRWDPKSSIFLRFGSLGGAFQLDASHSCIVNLQLIPDNVARHIILQGQIAKHELFAEVEKFCEALQITPTSSAPLCSDPTCLNLATGSVIRMIHRMGLSIANIVDPKKFDDLPFWVLSNQFKAILRSCETIIPWSHSQISIFVEREDSIYGPKYHVHPVDFSLSARPLQAIILTDPIETGPSFPQSISHSPRLTHPCALAACVNKIWWDTANVQNGIRGVQLAVGDQSTQTE
ncbi:hypothetical protein TWF281_007493 [Arthrobotrys megalospora]